MINIKWYCDSYADFKWMYNHILVNEYVKNVRFDIDDIKPVIEEALNDSERLFLFVDSDLELAYCSSIFSCWCHSSCNCECKDYPFRSINQYQRELKLNRILG